MLRFVAQTVIRRLGDDRVAIPRFYTETLLTNPGPVAIDGEEARHALLSLRLRAGDEVVVFDGRGGRGVGRVAETGRRSVRVLVERVERREAPHPRVTLATAIPKGKRWPFLVEKAVELGAARIVPVHFARGVAKGEGDPERWRRWAIEAAKQCGRDWLPEIDPPSALADILSRAEGVKWLADPGGDGAVDVRPIADVTVLVGPEGGVTEDERGMCRAAGFAGLCLSRNILRVETAALAACALLCRPA